MSTCEKFDLDGDGYITKSEAGSGDGHTDPQQASIQPDIFSWFDEDDDGRISEAEVQ